MQKVDMANCCNVSEIWYSLHPSINLKFEVQITCNSGNICDGTYFHPYDLVCTTCG